jgi:tetratricopeptide (TPR) repeat protein
LLILSDHRLFPALELFREEGVALGIASARMGLGDIALAHRDYARAKVLFQEELALGRQHDDQIVVASALLTLARVARAEGDAARAVALFEESLVKSLDHSEALGTLVRYELGKATLEQGDYERATALLRECVTEHQELGWTIPCGLEGLGAVAAAQGASARAARLWGAAEAIREATGLTMDAHDAPDYARWVTSARAPFESADFNAAWAEGRAMSVEQAIAYAGEGTGSAEEQSSQHLLCQSR